VTLYNPISLNNLQKWPKGVELNRVSTQQPEERACDTYSLQLKRLLQNKLLTDAHQKRGRMGPVEL